MKLMKPCPNCAIRWVDQACSTAQIQLRDMERQQLVAALLARCHLILSGPTGVGKLRLARALASSIAHDQKGEARTIQGHPWWAADTGDISRYVMMQTDFSLWRLVDFVEPMLAADWTPFIARTNTDSGLVACVERMSLLEIDLYFGQFVSWLSQHTAGAGHPSTVSGSLRLIGTYDSPEPPCLDHYLERLVAVVHLDRVVFLRPVDDFIEQKSYAA